MNYFPSAYISFFIVIIDIISIFIYVNKSLFCFDFSCFFFSFSSNIDKIKNKAYIGSTSIMREEEKQKLLKSYNPNVQPFDMVKDLYKETEGEPAINTMSMIDIINYLEGDIYLNVDKTSTAHGLEIRMPLTDIRMFDIASRLPADFKVTEEQNKIALRTAASKVLPEEVAFRKKLGFVVPVS